MSNDRIDLTQFDNITSYPDGGWEVPEEDNLSKTLVADLDGSLVCSTSAMAQIEGYSLEEAQHFARTIAQLPNIVAELKRRYEELDRAQCFIQQGWVKFESYTDDGKDLFVDMEDDDGNRFSGWISRAQASE